MTTRRVLNEMNLLLTTLCLLAATCPAVAQFTGETVSGQADTMTTPTPSLTLTGYIEAYYTHDFTASKTTQERPVFLYNHKRNREVNINLAYAKVAYLTNNIRGNLALQIGTYAQYNYAAEQELIRTIYEANVGIKLTRRSDLWLDAGIFSSHIGFESAISKDCWTLTRSIQAENSPYYLAGAKLTYSTPNTKWTVLASVINGWQRIKRLPGYSGPSVSTQVQFRPSGRLTVNWSSFLGSDRPDSLRQIRFFNDFYAILQPTTRLGITLGYDLGIEQKPFVQLAGERIAGYNPWSAFVAIVRYKTSDRSYLAGRFEQYNDTRGVLIGIPGFQTTGYSLNYDYAILPVRAAGAVLARIEAKLYESKIPVFKSLNGFKQANMSVTTSLAISF